MKAQIAQEWRRNSDIATLIGDSINEFLSYEDEEIDVFRQKMLKRIVRSHLLFFFAMFCSVSMVLFPLPPPAFGIVVVIVQLKVKWRSTVQQNNMAECFPEYYLGEPLLPNLPQTYDVTVYTPEKSNDTKKDSMAKNLRCSVTETVNELRGKAFKKFVLSAQQVLIQLSLGFPFVMLVISVADSAS